MTQTHSFMHWMSTGFQVWTNSIQKWRTMKTKVSEECVLSGSCAWHLTLHTHTGAAGCTMPISSVTPSCVMHFCPQTSHCTGTQFRTHCLISHLDPRCSSSENSVHPEPFVPGCPGTHTEDKTHSLIRKQDKILSMTSVL